MQGSHDFFLFLRFFFLLLFLPCGDFDQLFLCPNGHLFRGEGSGHLVPGRDGIRFSFPHQ